MKRAAWTDERLDDFSGRMDGGFERVDRDIRDLRTEMSSGFAEVRRDFAEVRREIDGLRSLMFRMNAGLIVAVVGGAIISGF